MTLTPRLTGFSEWEDEEPNPIQDLQAARHYLRQDTLTQHPSPWMPQEIAPELLTQANLPDLQELLMAAYKNYVRTCELALLYKFVNPVVIQREIESGRIRRVRPCSKEVFEQLQIDGEVVAELRITGCQESLVQALN
ncbi:MAG: hypothetical protein AAF528_01155 [Cyanobacteria bacterium P01_C01_bin.121]